jgi:hypothetical protein
MKSAGKSTDECTRVIFKWLSECVDSASFKLRELVEKKYATMSKGDLTGLWICSSTDE